MRVYSDEYVNYYGDRFIALDLRGTGLTFEQYLSAPRYHESRELERRIRASITTERDVAIVSELSRTVAWCRSLAETGGKETAPEAREQALTEILRICTDGPMERKEGNPS